MFKLQKLSRRGKAREQIAIRQVRDGVLELANYQYRLILEVSPVNFELKSEAEQDGIIDTYESFLNSVGYPLQILIRTREIDMDKYLAGIKTRLDKETEEVYVSQLDNYDEFIRSLITSNKILTRKFYIIVPHSGSGKEDFELVKEQLNLAEDIVTKGISRLGMSARRLSSLEVLDLFYSFYSPEQSKIQPLTEQAIQMMADAFTVQSDKSRSDKQHGKSGLSDGSSNEDDFSNLAEFEEIEMIIKESAS